MAQGNPLPPLPPRTVLRKGTYTIESLLGTGGFAHVYKARDRNGHPFALKQCKANDAETNMQFGAELAILAMLAPDCKYFPVVYERFAETPSGAQGESSFAAMEYVPGTTLDKVLDERLAHGRGPCPEAEVTGWMVQLLEALEYAHSSRVIHRDVKPSNVMLLPDGKTIKIIDVGIAKQGGEGMKTEASGAAVSPHYSPPEQYVMRGGKTDYYSDIYAVGATMYQLLTGALPPEASSRMAGIEELTPPRALNPQIGPQTEGVILRALEMDVRRRYGSAREMGDALLGKAAKPAGPTASKPLACPNCGAGNKTGARHCANCGAALVAPFAAPVVMPFVFAQAGVTVSTVAEFADACDAHWAEAVGYLMTPQLGFDQWFNTRSAPERQNLLGALQAARSRFPNDPYAQLEALLRSLGKKSPTCEHNWRELADELGLGLGPGGTLRWAFARRGPASVNLIVRHTGRRGYLHGKAHCLVNWLDIRQPEFRCFPTDKAVIKVDVDWPRRRVAGLRPKLIELHIE